MRRMQSFKYELQPDGEQDRDMRKISGAFLLSLGFNGARNSFSALR